MHWLFIRPVSDKSSIAEFQLRFELPGTQAHDTAIESLIVEDATKKEQLNFNFNIKNLGNVIARGSPRVNIFKDENLIDSFGNKTQIMVMPADDYNLSMLYDPSVLEFGDYSVEIDFFYNDGRQTDTLSQDFSIVEKKDAIEMPDIKEKSIYEGENLDIDLNLRYYKDTHFNIIYDIVNTSVKGNHEGNIIADSTDKVKLEVNTGELTAGQYNLNLHIQYGDNMKKIITKEIELDVKSHSEKIMRNVVIGFAFLVFLGYCLKPVIFPDNPEEKKIKTIATKLRKTDESFNQLELSMKYLIADVSKWMDESNHYLKKKFGGGKYEFK